MYPFFIQQFIQKFDPIIITSQSVYNRHSEQLDNIFAFGVRSNKGPTIDYHGDQTVLVFASDPNNRPEFLHNYIKKNSINYALTPYYQPFLHYIPDFNEDKLIHFPWALPEKFVVSPNEISYRGENYVALTGASGEEIYEVRDWCRNQSGVKSYETSGHKNRRFTHSEYYKWLQQFDAMIAAGSFQRRWQYLFAKYYEIPAAGGLLFAQYTDDLERAGFSDENCLIFNSKDHFTKLKDQYLDSPSDYIDIRRRGAEHIAMNHTIGDRVRLINELFEY